MTLFSKPIESDPNSDDASKPNKRPTISEAVSNIKTDDFVNVTNTPCARNGFMTGIIGAGGVGGVKFLLSGKGVACGGSNVNCKIYPVMMAR